MKVVLASHNPHKLVEIREILQPLGIDVVLESELGVAVEVEETGTTFAEHAYLKAKAVMEATGLPALADDSGIAVKALGGAPGIYSARYGGDPTLDDWGRLQLLLQNTAQVPDGQRQAKFVAAIALVYPDGQQIAVQGEVHGELLRQPVGEGGFGYDPIFYYPPAGKSFAQLTAEEKNQVSHRARALRSLLEKLSEEREYADQ